MSEQQLNEIASLYNCRIYRSIDATNDNGGVMVQMAESLDSWLNLWNVGWYDDVNHAIQATIEHLKECKQMNIFSTNLFPYLEGLMIKDNPIALTIKNVTQEELASERGKELKLTIHFKERDKALILNKTNAKTLLKFFGPETNDWHGQKIGLHAEHGKWFGKEGWAVRVDDKLPAQPKKRKPKKEEVITAEQAELLASNDPGAFE